MSILSQYFIVNLIMIYRNVTLSLRSVHLHHHSAVKFLSCANLIKELYIKDNRPLTILQFKTDDESVEKENIYCDRILLSITNHQNVTVIDTKCGIVSTTSQFSPTFDEHPKTKKIKIGVPPRNSLINIICYTSQAQAV